MSNTKDQTMRIRLGVTVSALAIAAAYGATSPASAQTVVLPSGFSTLTINSTLAASTREVEIPNGVKAEIVPSWAAASWMVGNNTALVLSPTNISALPACSFLGFTYAGAASCLSHSPVIQVDKGGTLQIAGVQSASYLAGNAYGFEGAIHADGDVILENEGVAGWCSCHVSDTFVGNNYFGGNLIVEAGAQPVFGASWWPSTPSFGPNSNITLGTGSVLSFYLPGTGLTTVGGALEGTGTLELYSGSLVFNGQNTAAAPFSGTLTASPGTTLMIGDTTHATAVFGDPGNPPANTLTIPGTSAGAPTLEGYGTIYANVVNTGGKVQPGGTAGKLGTLTVQTYKQDAVGTLSVEVNPTSVAGLHVLGNASLNGTLNVTIDPGSYATKIYNVVQVDGTMTGDFASITTSSTVVGAIGAVTKSANGYQVVTEVVQGAAATAPIVVGHLVSANRLNNYYLIGSLYDQIAQDAPSSGVEIAPNKYVWMEGFGRHSSVSREDVGYHTTTEGLTLGAEYRPTYHNATIGFAASYSSETLKAKGASTANIDAYSFAAYGGADVQYARLDGALFYNSYHTSTKRDFSSNGVAETRPGGYAYGASIQLSHSMFRDLVTPYLRGIFTRQHLDSSYETGAYLLNLRYNAINENTFAADVGFRINPLRSYPESKNKLLVTVALEHDFSALGENVTGTFPVTNGQNWYSYWRGDSENTGLVDIDIARRVTDKLEISGRVNGRASLYQTSGEISLGAKYRF